MIDSATMAVLHDAMGDGEAVQLWRYEERRTPEPSAGSVWRSLAGFRLSAAPEMRIAVSWQGETFVADRPVPKPARLSTIIRGDTIIVSDMGDSFVFTRERTDGGGGAAASGSLVAPMPGRIV